MTGISELAICGLLSWCAGFACANRRAFARALSARARGLICGVVELTEFAWGSEDQPWAGGGRLSSQCPAICAVGEMDWVLGEEDSSRGQSFRR